MKWIGWFYRLIFRGNYQQSMTDRIALGFFDNSKRVLDIGCGDGRFIGLNPAKIEGMDGSRVAVSICKKKGYRVKRGLATKLPYKANIFNGVHCSHVIEHLEPRQAHKLLREINRVLKVGGIVVIRSPLLWSGFYDDFSHVKPYNPMSILRYMEDNGANKTMESIGGKYTKLALIWRYRTILDILYPLGIHSLQKNGYMLALKKIA